MVLFEQIVSDYHYLENIIEGHRKLLRRYANEWWELFSITDQKKKLGICELCGKTGIRHLYKMRNIKSDYFIEIGIGCYRKHLLKDSEVKNVVNDHDTKLILSNQQEINDKRKMLEVNFRQYINNEFPLLKQKARDYQISFDESEFHKQISNWEQMKFAVSKIRTLKNKIEQYEFEKRKREMYFRKKEQSQKMKEQSSVGKSPIKVKKQQKTVPSKKSDENTAQITNATIAKAWKAHKAKGKLTYKQKCENMIARLLKEGHTNKVIVREVKNALGLKKKETMILIKKLS